MIFLFLGISQVVGLICKYNVSDTLNQIACSNKILCSKKQGVCDGTFHIKKPRCFVTRTERGCISLELCLLYEDRGYAANKTYIKCCNENYCNKIDKIDSSQIENIVNWNLNGKYYILYIRFFY